MKYITVLMVCTLQVNRPDSNVPAKKSSNSFLIRATFRYHFTKIATTTLCLARPCRPGGLRYQQHSLWQTNTPSKECSGRHCRVVVLLRSTIFGNDKVRYRLATLRSALSVTYKRLSCYPIEEESAPPQSDAMKVLAHDGTCLDILKCLGTRSLLHFGTACTYSRGLAGKDTLWEPTTPRQIMEQEGNVQ